MVSPPAHPLHVVAGFAGRITSQAGEQVRRHLGEPVEYDGRDDDRTRDEQQRQREAASRHPAAQRGAPPSLASVQDQAGGDADHTGRDQEPPVLHRDGHEGTAAQPQDNHGEWQQAAEGRQDGTAPRDKARAQHPQLHRTGLRTTAR
jgi:hypothetical protein